jgi:hypothetical protein
LEFGVRGVQHFVVALELFDFPPGAAVLEPHRHLTRLQVELPGQLHFALRLQLVLDLEAALQRPHLVEREAALLLHRMRQVRVAEDVIFHLLQRTISECGIEGAFLPTPYQCDVFQTAVTRPRHCKKTTLSHSQKPQITVTNIHRPRNSSSNSQALDRTYPTLIAHLSIARGQHRSQRVGASHVGPHQLHYVLSSEAAHARTRHISQSPAILETSTHTIASLGADQMRSSLKNVQLIFRQCLTESARTENSANNNSERVDGVGVL